MRTVTRVVSAIALALTASQVSAQAKSFESCSLTAWEVFSAIDDFMLGVPLEKARSKAGIPQNVDSAYQLAKKDGIAKAYLAAHVHYRKCASEIPRDVAPKSKQEQAFRACALNTATRTNILVRIEERVPIDQTKAKMPQSLHQLIDLLYRTSQESGVVKGWKLSADEAKSCVERVRKVSRDT